MTIEIERKFLIKEMPDLKGCKPLKYERYFLFRNAKTEIRIQKKGNSYEFERKEKDNKLSSTKTKFKISKEEFDKLKKFSTEKILRESYQLAKNPDTTIKIYHGPFEGLIRVEVEFKSEAEAKHFQPLPWFGKEITTSPLGKDSQLIDLTKREFQNLLKLA